MTTSIELDEAAFARLKAIRRDDESWSEVIKRCVKPKPSMDRILKTLRGSTLSLETLDAIDASVTRRRRRARSRKP